MLRKYNTLFGLPGPSNWLSPITGLICINSSIMEFIWRLIPSWSSDLICKCDCSCWFLAVKLGEREGIITQCSSQHTCNQNHKIRDRQWSLHTFISSISCFLLRLMTSMHTEFLLNPSPFSWWAFWPGCNNNNKAIKKFIALCLTAETNWVK